MAIWDGLVVDPVAAQDCGTLLRDTASTLEEQKAFDSDDSDTTINANNNCTQSLASLNEIRLRLGDYLDIDDSNLATIVESIAGVDASLSESYSCED